MRAETAYLFRHALLREAAYQMQLPRERAAMHALVLDIVASLFGGMPNPVALQLGNEAKIEPHPIDAYAGELADHAIFAAETSENPEALLDTARNMLCRAGMRSGRNYSHAEAIRYWRRLADLSEGAARADCIRRAGVVAYRAGNWAQAEPLYDESLAEARRHGEERLEGILLGNLAVIYDDTGRVELSERTFEKALEVLERVGEVRFRGFALGNLAVLYHNTDRLTEAEGLFTEAIALIHEAGDYRAEGAVLSNLANLLADLGRNEESKAAYAKAVELHRQTNDRRSEGIALSNMAHTYAVEGDPQAGEAAFREAYRIHQEVGDLRFEGITLLNLAALQNEYLRRPEEAERTCLDALEIIQSVGDQRFEAVGYCNLAIIRVATGDYESAKRLWKTGAELYAKLGDRLSLKEKSAAMKRACKKAGIQPFNLPEGFEDGTE